MERQKPTDINATEMQSPVHEVLSITELLEHILLQVDSIWDITRARRVCQRWRSLIQDSPALQRACWYRSHGEPDPAKPREWKLNPVFASLGMSVTRYHYNRPPVNFCDQGDFDLTKCIYDKPGSWTPMLATQPPCRWMQVELTGATSGNEMFYFIESTTGCLLAGDVMAVLAECQNRLEMGVDCWGDVGLSTGKLFPAAETDDLDMADDVSVKVAVGWAWVNGDFPAFSLRRVHAPHAAGGDDYAEHDSASYMAFVHELVVHRMEHSYLGPNWRICKEGEYQANLLAVRNYEGKYLAACSHIFRSLSDL